MSEPIDAEFVGAAADRRECSCPGCRNVVRADQFVCSICETLCIAIAHETHRRLEQGEALIGRGAAPIRGRMRATALDVRSVVRGGTKLLEVVDSLLETVLRRR